MTEKKRIGRPVVEAAPGERAGLSLRVTAAIKTRLEEEAAKNGRSLSQEAELRLERSFNRDEAARLLEDLRAFREEVREHFQQITSWEDLRRRAQQAELTPVKGKRPYLGGVPPPIPMKKRPKRHEG